MMFSLFIWESLLQSLLHARHYSRQWTVAKVSEVLETHIWASEAWLPSGKRTQACMQTGCALWTERRTKLPGLSFPPSKLSSKLPCLPSKPILPSEAFKASLIWFPTCFPSPSNLCYSPARMGAATEHLDSENVQCARSSVYSVYRMYSVHVVQALHASFHLILSTTHGIGTIISPIAQMGKL